MDRRQRHGDQLLAAIGIVIIIIAGTWLLLVGRFVVGGAALGMGVGFGVFRLWWSRTLHDEDE